MHGLFTYLKNNASKDANSKGGYSVLKYPPLILWLGAAMLVLGIYLIFYQPKNNEVNDELFAQIILVTILSGSGIYLIFLYLKREIYYNKDVIKSKAITGKITDIKREDIKAIQAKSFKSLHQLHLKDGTKMEISHTLTGSFSLIHEIENELTH